MIHRAILGSFERFIGILIENYSGKLPFWLAPQQVVVASIVSEVNDYAIEVKELLKDCGIRAETDLRNEKISYKVRDHMKLLKKILVLVQVTWQTLQLNGTEILLMHCRLMTLFLMLIKKIIL